MSNLSHPPLDFLPTGRDPVLRPLPTATSPSSSSLGFAWPVPPGGDYPEASVAASPEPCEVEGLNGRVLHGLLEAFDPTSLKLQLLTPSTRTPVNLRFTQFRRLSLTTPLQPPADGLADGSTAEMPATVPFSLRFREGAPLMGRSVSPVETEYGVFLFEPVAPRGALRRSFVPRAVCEQIDVGPHIGELLGQVDTVPLTPLDTLPAAASTPQLAPAERTAHAGADDEPLHIEPMLQPLVPEPVSPTDARVQMIGDALSAREVTDPAQLEAALAAQARMPMVRIGEALLALKRITTEQLDEALQAQREDRSVPLGELLVRRRAITRADLQEALTRKMGYPMVDLRAFQVEAEAVAKVPHHIASRLSTLPLILRGSRLIVAMDDPSHRSLLEELEFVSQCTVVPVLARSQDIDSALARAYDRLGVGAWLPADGLNFDHPAAEPDTRDASELLASMEMQGSTAREEPEEAPIEQSDNSLVKLINTMILEAKSQGVSDIHIECQPGREKVRIRFRKDGQLRPYLELPHNYRSALIARLKIMCDLDISERRKPQDGKINFGKFQPGAKLELRLATIPTHSGLEDAVLRLLASAKPLPLEKLGLSPANLAGLKAVMERPYGMLLCVGPTGSGKTTTLHSAMGHINTPDRKIWTAEDPIEITQHGLRQVQVNAKIDWTFAKALRAFLRADPDVVMVGEIRDHETAQMAVEASLTGHLVLSTLHTNSAAETVTRLLDMGMDPFNFADSLLGVLAQRLVRRLCIGCLTSREATDDEIDEWMGDYLHAFGEPEVAPSRETLLSEWTGRFAKDGRLRFHNSPGCAQCDGSGHSGRAAIHELLVVSRDTKRLIQTGSRAEQILVAAQREGMRTLRQDGIEKVLSGVTSIEEVRSTSNG